MHCILLVAQVFVDDTIFIGLCTKIRGQISLSLSFLSYLDDDYREILYTFVLDLQLSPL